MVTNVLWFALASGPLAGYPKRAHAHDNRKHPVYHTRFPMCTEPADSKLAFRSHFTCYRISLLGLP